MSNVLSWPYVLKTYAQSIDGKKRNPDMATGRPREAIAREVGFFPTDVNKRVQQIVDALVANKEKNIRWCGFDAMS